MESVAPAAGVEVIANAVVIVDGDFVGDVLCVASKVTILGDELPRVVL